MSEFINSNIVDAVLALWPVILGAFFATWVGIGCLLRSRNNAKKVALPHTMSESEYVQLNEKRFNVSPRESCGTGGPGGA